MKLASGAGLLSLVCLFLPSSPLSAQDKKKGASKDDAFYSPAKVHAIHLELSPEEWKKMQPPKGFGMFPGGGFPKGPKKAEEKKDDKERDVHKSAGAFGTEFPWAKAQFVVDGEIFKSVGIRFKGNFTYISSAQMLRRPIKIDLDHYGVDQRLNGQKKVNLSNGITDPARLRETLAFSVYRAAGLPASRTTYAELTLTVPGLYNKELVGLYTVIEQVDKPFLKAHFKDSKGMLMKPENLRGGLEYLGEDWSRYEDKYRPKDEPTKEQQQRLIGFTRLIHRADDATFRKEVGNYLDVDAFLRSMAVDALLSHLDSYLGYGHNFYLYLRPDTNQFVFMPWDLDLSLAMWPAAGTPEQLVNLSLDHPHMGQNKLIDRLLAIKEMKEKYRQTLKELTTTVFTKEKLLQQIEAIEKTVAEPLARERKAAAARREGKGGGMGIISTSLSARQFAERRTESVLAQLAGERKGFVPSGFGFGPPGGPGGPPKGGFGPGTFLAKPLLEAIDTGKDGKVSREEAVAGAKQFFKDCDKDATGFLNEEIIAEGINRIVPRPKGFPAPPGGGKFGMGNLMAGTVVKRADANKDGKVSLEEWVAATEGLFKEAAKGSKTLTEAEVATGLNLLVTRPAFGPPGGPPLKKE